MALVEILDILWRKFLTPPRMEKLDLMVESLQEQVFCKGNAQQDMNRERVAKQTANEQLKTENGAGFIVQSYEHGNSRYDNRGASSVVEALEIFIVQIFMVDNRKFI